eukprot:jgi/Hompol1/6070/HPOL_002751-RA
MFRTRIAQTLQIPVNRMRALIQRRAYTPEPNYSPDTADMKVPQALVVAGVGYLSIVNGVALALFFYDKNQANNKGWRLTALLGGWIGGLYAMQTFRHKTVKKSFQQPYLACVGLNIAALAGLAAAWRYNPRLRSGIHRMLQAYGLA